MATQSDRVTETGFYVFMAREFPEVQPSQLVTLMKLAKQHHRLQENACNHEVPENHDAKCVAKIRALCEEIGCEPVFSGDPRGATVKLRVPSGKTTDWGGIGICVPS